MTMTAAEWALGVPEQARRYSIAFLQLGVAFSELRDQVLALDAVQADARELLKLDSLTTIGQAGDELLLITGLESIVRTRGEGLGTLRERVVREATTRRGVVLVSRSPRTAFPEAVGSDVIHDARQIFAPHEFASFVDAESRSRVHDCVRELGDRTVIALSDAMWEEGLNSRDVLASLDRVYAEALRGAGIASVIDEELRWTTSVTYKELRHAIGDASSESVVVGPAVSDTFTELWVLERLIRNAVRAAIVVKHGAGWRETCLDQALKQEVLERAQRDSHPSARRVTDLRDPLEWLSTSELLDLREKMALGTLGLAAPLWLKLRSEIVPIRNRAAHMRLLGANEARKVASWRRIASGAFAK